MSEVEISIGGKKYTIACNPGEEKDVLAASEELDKEAKNIINSLGKVSDVKLLLMAGLMIGGRLKAVEEEFYGKSNEIVELQNKILTLKNKNQKLASENNDSKIYEKEENTDLYMDDNSLEKILKSIHFRLNALIEDKNRNILEDKEEEKLDKSKENSSDQQELF